jgi:cytochrome P450
MAGEPSLSMQRQRREIPEPPEFGVINALRFGTDPLRFLDGVQARFNDILAVPIPGRAPLVIVTNPRLIQEALSQPDQFTRVSADGAAALIAERGLVQSEDDLWQQQRSIMRPAFGGKQVRAYTNTVGEQVTELADEWANDLTNNPQRNLHREMTSVTIRVASKILLGEDISRDRAEQFYEWMRIAGDELEFSPTSIRPSWLPNTSSQEMKRAAEGVQELSEEIIERRRARLADEPDERPADMLGLLLKAEDDPSVSYPPNQIRDEVATFLIAGHETTALSLTYTLALLSWNPEARDRVREEAIEVLGEDGATPTHDHVADLDYTRQVYDEALRLYPPAWAVFREASSETYLDGYRVEEGSAVIFPQWSVHRDKRHFPNPRQFDPDRWENQSPNGTEGYFAFGAGPHACIGQQLARSGALLVLSHLTQNFDIDVGTDALENLQATPTLRPSSGITANVTFSENN